MSRQPTLIERLEVKHPGLEEDVCNWLKSYVTGAEIAARLLAKYHETVGPKTINNYKRKRLDHELEEIRKQKIQYVACMQIVGEKGLDAGAAAKLWEALKTMTPTELIALRRLQVARARVKVLDKRAENERAKIDATLAQLKEEQANEASRQPPPDPLVIRQRIRDIFGLPDETEKLRREMAAREQACTSAADAERGTREQPAEPDGSEPDESASDALGPRSDE